MPLTKIENCKVGKGATNISLVLDGHRFSFDPETALKISNTLGNAAADNIGPQSAIPVATEVNLHPLADGALIRLFTNDGQLVVRIGYKHLHGLSAAAAAVLELGPTVGKA